MSSTLSTARRSPHIVATISVGQTSEGVAMSSDGAYAAVTVMNGSNRAKDHPAYDDYGLLTIFSIKGTTLKKSLKPRSVIGARAQPLGIITRTW